MLPKLKAPNYTQVPNLILDEWLSLLDPSLFKIVMYIARKTFGWRIEKEKMSFNQIVEGTGLCRKTVIVQVQKGLEIGALDREPIHGTNEFCYFLPLENVLAPTPNDDLCKNYTDPSVKITQTDAPSVNSTPPPSVNSTPPPSDGYIYKETHVKETLSPPSRSWHTPAGAVGGEMDLTEEERRAWEAHKADMKARGKPIMSEDGLKKWFLDDLRKRIGGQKKSAESQEERIDRHKREAAILLSRSEGDEGIRLSMRDVALEVYFIERRCCYHIGYALSNEEWACEIKELEKALPSHLKTV